MKWWNSPPSWETTRLINLAVALVCGSMAWSFGPSWGSTVDAFFAGTAVGLIIWITVGAIPQRNSMKRADSVFDELAKAYEDLLQVKLSETGHNAPPITPEI
jgi:hypothetical protein